MTEAELQMLLKNPEQLKAFITQPHGISNLEFHFPEEKARLAEFIFNNPDLLEKYITQPHGISNLKFHFPIYAYIFDASSIDGANNKINNFREIQKKAKTISVLQKGGLSFFSCLPVEVGVKIAAFTGDASVHTHNESEKIATKYFSSPNFTN